MSARTHNSTRIHDEIRYKCEFCGVEKPADEWRMGGYQCPHCGRIYEPDADTED